MLNDWSILLNRTLKRLELHRPVRTAVMGIGHELRGDDAAGIMVAQVLQPLFAANPDVLIIDGGHAPENQTGVLRRFVPDIVLLVDAVLMGVSAGMVYWLSWQEASGLSASTHTLPLHVIAQYLTAEFGCEVALIGIQPAQMALDAALSAPVKEGVDDIVKTLTVALKRRKS